jgi:hypothetical protein
MRRLSSTASAASDTVDNSNLTKNSENLQDRSIRHKPGCGLLRIDDAALDTVCAHNHGRRWYLDHSHPMSFFKAVYTNERLSLTVQ